MSGCFTCLLDRLGDAIALPGEVYTERHRDRGEHDDQQTALVHRCVFVVAG
jgi:hypothetical protein